MKSCGVKTIDSNGDSLYVSYWKKTTTGGRCVMALLPFWWIPTLIKLKIFQNADKAARRLICTDIGRKLLELLLSCTTAREMWLKLSSVYDLKSNENVELM